MQKVRSYYFLFITWAAYKTTISILSLTVLVTIAYILYYSLRGRFPYIIIQTDFFRFTFYLILLQDFQSLYKIKFLYNIIK